MRHHLIHNAAAVAACILVACALATCYSCSDDDNPARVDRHRELQVIVETGPIAGATFTVCLAADTLPISPWCVTSTTPWQGRTVAIRGDLVELQANMASDACLWIIFQASDGNRDGGRYCPTNGIIETDIILGK